MVTVFLNTTEEAWTIDDEPCRHVLTSDYTDKDVVDNDIRPCLNLDDFPKRYIY